MWLAYWSLSSSDNLDMRKSERSRTDLFWVVILPFELQGSACAVSMVYKL